MTWSRDSSISAILTVLLGWREGWIDGKRHDERLGYFPH